MDTNTSKVRGRSLGRFVVKGADNSSVGMGRASAERPSTRGEPHLLAHDGLERSHQWLAGRHGQALGRSFRCCGAMLKISELTGMAMLC
jgi:hypothetical protein